MKKKTIIYIFIVLTLCNLYSLRLYLNIKQDNLRLNQNLNRINTNNREIIRNIISGIVSEHSIKNESLNKLQNSIIIRIPPGTCIACINDFFISLRDINFVDKNSIVILTSFTKKRQLNELQSQVEYKCINIPDLKLNFKNEKIPKPYFFLKKDNKIQFPIESEIGLHNLLNYKQAISTK